MTMTGNKKSHTIQTNTQKQNLKKITNKHGEYSPVHYLLSIQSK